MSNLLINEPPLQVLPSLAVKIGLNEAIILQQIHYWMRISKNKRDGSIWVYKTYAEWQEEFPFWSKSTIIRTINNLEKNGYLVSTAKYNKMKIDKTKWYTINIGKLNDSTSTQNEQMVYSDEIDTTTQIDYTDYSKRVDVSTQIEQTNNHRLPENTSETTQGGGRGQNIFNYYQTNIATLSSHVTQELMYAADEFGEEVVMEAINIAAAANKRNWTYINGILKNWRNHNVKTLEDIKKLESGRKSGKKEIDWGSL